MHIFGEEQGGKSVSCIYAQEGLHVTSRASYFVQKYKLNIWGLLFSFLQVENWD